jgi:hypothetical protein
MPIVRVDPGAYRRQDPAGLLQQSDDLIRGGRRHMYAGPEIGDQQGILEPLGADLKAGPDAYFVLMRRLAEGLSTCRKMWPGKESHPRPRGHKGGDVLHVSRSTTLGALPVFFFAVSSPGQRERTSSSVQHSQSPQKPSPQRPYSKYACGAFE